MHRMRRYLPNRLGEGKLAMLALRPDGTPMPGAWRPFSAVQLLGGRRWSLSIIRREDVRSSTSGPVNRMDVEEAYDALIADDADPARAAELLQRALRS